ncbi:DUF2142 domain-containing protein [Herbiconiux moechotypicola]|uniref:DUF2142 domain-containing protein n=1 Tax=Herbiconiux moechotypicola TaxID=637393 RepID=A0ABN3DUV6_9MICO|nr:DUF2142 domain-containing protein [Herbiconiux moechotypicola]MCS5731022.1 DUF2142 domain-containing protein [Herbiconiux moechotypicola]
MTVAPAPHTTQGRRSVLRALLLPWLLLAVLGTLWALATPLSGSPDEPAHVIKAASVVRGQLLPSEMLATGGVVEVPAAVAHENVLGCFAFHPDVDASCAPAFEGDPAELVETTTSASLYNPLYYWVVGWPSLLAPDTAGIYGMRIVSAVLCAGFLAAAFWMIAGWARSRVPALGALVAVTPLVLYLSATVNPNAVEFTAGLALFTAMLGIVLHPSPDRLVPRLVLIVVAATLVSNARGISPLWVALLLVLPLVLLRAREVLALLRRPVVIAAIALVVAGAAVSAWWTLSSNSLGTAPSSGPDVAPPNEGVGLSPLQGFVGQFGDLYNQLRQMIGVLGWLDTTLHPVVYLVYYALFAVVAVAVVLFVRGRALVFTALLAAAFLLLPPLIQSFYITRGGYIWQGRYTLVLLVSLLVGAAAVVAASPRFAAWLERPRAPRILAVVSWAMAAGWVFATVFAFATGLRRVTAGYTAGWGEMLDAAAWQPPLGAVTLLVLYALAAAGFAVAVLLGVSPTRAHAITPARSVRG